MSSELDLEWYVILYYDSGRVRSYKTPNPAQWLLDHPELHGDIQADTVPLNEARIVRFHFVAPDWYPARAKDSKSGNTFAVTQEEKYSWRRAKTSLWNPRGMFRTARGAGRGAADAIPKTGSSGREIGF